MRIGAHVSIEGGLSRAVERAVAIGAECLQMFVSPPQSWRPPSHSAETVAEFKASRRAADVWPLFLHTVYLLNLASGKASLRTSSLESLVSYLGWAEKLEADGVITHQGSARDMGPAEAETAIVEALGRVLDAARGDVPLLMETTAGPGKVFGSTFQELGAVLNRLGKPERLRVCL
ncbi:MAG: TIM barrel protein, partial [Chloroflexota bacterium]